MEGFALHTKFSSFEDLTPAVLASLQREAPGTPIAVAGQLRLEGNGKGWAKEGVNLGVSFNELEMPVSYTLNSDCRGTISLNVCPTGTCTESSSITAASDGSDIRWLNTVPQTTIKGFMKRVSSRPETHHCSTSMVAGTYRFDTSWFPIWSTEDNNPISFDVLFATAGITKIERDGSSSWTDAFSLAGININPRNYSGNFSINDDCSGVIAGVAGVYVSPEGRRFVLVSSVPGSVYNGWFDRQSRHRGEDDDDRDHD